LAKEDYSVRYVYVLQSQSCCNERYIGISTDFQQRIKDHNTGKSPHTSKFRPWKPVVVMRFDDDERAEAFERYLKSGSGHAFAKRHFW
jgi:predicted GIY-YIG superfamily endonuclease